MEVTFKIGQWLYEGVTIVKLDHPEKILDPIELYDCLITGAKLSGSTLRRWVFEECIFTDCDLSNLTFDQCVFEGCLFKDCRLIGSKWRLGESLLNQLSFIGCDLSLSDLSQGNFSEVKFEDCLCTDVDFSGSILRQSHFLNTSIDRAMFEQSDLSEANLSGALHGNFSLDETILTNATVSVTTAIRVIESLGLKVDRSHLLKSDDLT